MLDRPIIGLAVWLSKPVGFLVTCFTVAAGLGAGALLSFNDHWALVFNLFLSIAAMLLAGVILVAGARDTSAIQIKLDELIRAVENADDRLVGIEERSAEELELIRQDRQPPLGANVGNEAEGMAEHGVARPSSV
ncbi:low affinity iron permease family protein [Methylobacterium sp. J-072]|uniref:low affinity iron permease family protein n=1 Tax=Methylobacterium sp. J-072 TaxID=2836651 RepID=UPI001FB98A90|nr:low affinity iron permease family protein [Methylobacterium sp. J-072]MCJ2093059.1 low affinity iron permease family protein [Methylobacterium sp. J-072]